MNKESVLNAILREDLAAFIEKSYHTVDGSQTYVPAEHITLLADKLADCTNGKIKRLIINLPPRSLKSISASVAFPAWLLGKRPNSRIVAVSYSDDLATKHARDCRSVMESDWYKRAFPKTRFSSKKRSEAEYVTTQNGYRISTSLGGTLTGRGGNVIIIDDPIKPQDALSDIKRKKCNEWFDNTLFSRLDNKEEGCIIIVMQRMHMEDLCAHVTRYEGWEVVKIPAIAEKDEVFTLSNGKFYKRKKGDVLNSVLESNQTLEIIKANIGNYNFSAQYQQEPIPSSGNIIKFDWFKYYDFIQEYTDGIDRIIQSWDTAMTAHDGSDYSACVTIHQKGKLFYIIDITCEKLDFPSLKKKVVDMQNIYNARDVIIEDKGAGTSLMQQLIHEGIPTIPYKPIGAKEDRICAQSSAIEAGAVFLPRNAPWIDDFKLEAISFPYGKHDDQLDALSQGLDWLRGGNISILDVL
jgi:predicted phage terminase large subunit-like protein